MEHKQNKKYMKNHIVYNCLECYEKRKAHKEEVLKDLNECIDVFGLKEQLEKVLLRYEEAGI